MSKDKDNFIGFKTNKYSREKALQFKSPDLSKLEAIQFDRNTIVYFKKSTPKKRIKERLEIYKNSKYSWE